MLKLNHNNCTIFQELGISLLVRTRFQLNVMFQRSSFISQSSKLKSEKLILPIAWMDYVSILRLSIFAQDLPNKIYFSGIVFCFPVLPF